MESQTHERSIAHDAIEDVRNIIHELGNGREAIEKVATKVGHLLGSEGPQELLEYVKAHFGTLPAFSIDVSGLPEFLPSPGMHYGLAYHPPKHPASLGEVYVWGASKGMWPNAVYENEHPTMVDLTGLEDPRSLTKAIRLYIKDAAEHATNGPLNFADWPAIIKTKLSLSDWLDQHGHGLNHLSFLEEVLFECASFSAGVQYSNDLGTIEDAIEYYSAEIDRNSDGCNVLCTDRFEVLEMMRESISELENEGLEGTDMPHNCTLSEKHVARVLEVAKKLMEAWEAWES